jgi:hypothetical protein
VSSIRPGARQLSLVSDQRQVEDGLLACEFNCIPTGENSQTNGSEHTIESNILTDPIFRKNVEEE